MSGQQDKRVILYPAYINSKRTVAQGRRIPADKACEDPNVVEIFDALKYLKLPADIEDKQYPRDWWLSRGRLRVALFNADGTPTNPEVPTRREMLLRIAELVPKHPGRHRKPGAAAGASGSSGGAAAGGGKQGSAKKSGKKKK
ncbi:MAG: signal recognition particle, SRP19 subunit [Monoraphidium minutum]|nr:MAG: signal recognition particle, SRP19 subunit [Monoraphidium minutum]